MAAGGDRAVGLGLKEADGLGYWDPEYEGRGVGAVAV